MKLTVAEYARILAKLPMQYLCAEYTELRHIIFHDRVIAAHEDYAPLVYKDGVWREIKMGDET